jgi:gas vesicle protein
MNDENYNNRNRRQSTGDNTFFAFMTGLALGAVAALLSNPDHREKLKRTFGDVQNKGQKMLADTTKKAENLADKVGDQAKELSDQVSNKAAELSKVAEDKAKQAQREVGRRTGGR